MPISRRRRSRSNLPISSGAKGYGEVVLARSLKPMICMTCVLTTGLLSLGMMRVITWLPPDPHRDFVPAPLVLVFGIMANVCYTLGPVAEVMIEKIWGRKLLPTGPTLFRIGLTFSLGLALLPTLITVFDWGFRVLRAIL